MMTSSLATQAPGTGGEGSMCYGLVKAGIGMALLFPAILFY